MPYADAPAARIYYETHGDGPTLLMIPGFGCTVEIYWANTPALAERHRVIVFDPRGAGRSTVPEGPYSMRQFAGDCGAVLDAVGVDAADVLGTSFGGMVAQHFALASPHRVRRLVLGCTTPGGPHHVLPAADRIATFLAAPQIDDPVAAVRSTLSLNYGDGYVAACGDQIVDRALRFAHLRVTPQGRDGQLAAVAAHDTWDRLPAITAPTLVAHGDDDGVVPYENGRNLAGRIPAATLRTFAGARHVFFVERAAEFNQDVARFLAAPAPARP